MDNILDWLAKYSPLVVFLIAVGAVHIFLVKIIAERVIDLHLQRRSNFVERVLLERYVLVRDIQMRISKVMTDLNRVKSGATVKELLRAGDIVPLTEVFELLLNNRFLITDRFHTILSNEAKLVLNFANAHHPQDLEQIESEYRKQQDSFDLSMNEVFGIDEITWQTGSLFRSLKLRASEQIRRMFRWVQNRLTGKESNR